MSRLRVRAISFALLVALATLSVPAVAFAGVAEYQVQFAPIGLSGKMDLIVNVVLTPDTKLPAKVRVPLPAGATILWSGEILGGDPSKDPSREATLTTVGGAQYAEFTLEQVRIAQVEAELGAAQIAGDRVTSKLAWINPTDAGTYTFSVRLEPKVTDVKITPKPEGEAQTNSDGESLYTLEPVRLEKGGTFSVDVSYRRTAADAAGSGGLSPYLTVAIVLLVIAVAALVVVLVKQGASSSVPANPRGVSRPGSAGDTPTSKSVSAGDEDKPDDDDEAFTWD